MYAVWNGMCIFALQVRLKAGGIPCRPSPHIAAASEHMHLIKISRALGSSTISGDTVADSGFGKIHNAADSVLIFDSYFSRYCS